MKQTLKTAWEFTMAFLIFVFLIRSVMDLGFDLFNRRIQKTARYCAKICENEFDTDARSVGVESSKVSCLCEGK